MPFASDVGVVTPVFKQGGQGNRAVVEYAFVSGLAFVGCRRGFRHIAYAVAVVVNAGQQHGACGGANGCGVKV